MISKEYDYYIKDEGLWVGYTVTETIDDYDWGVLSIEICEEAMLMSIFTLYGSETIYYGEYSISILNDNMLDWIDIGINELLKDNDESNDEEIGGGLWKI